MRVRTSGGLRGFESRNGLALPRQSQREPRSGRGRTGLELDGPPVGRLGLRVQPGGQQGVAQGRLGYGGRGSRSHGPRSRLPSRRYVPAGLGASQRRQALRSFQRFDRLAGEGQRIARRAHPQGKGRLAHPHPRSHARGRGPRQCARLFERGARLVQAAEPGEHPGQHKVRLGVAGSLACRFLQDLDRVVRLPLGELGLRLGHGVIESLVRPGREVRAQGQGQQGGRQSHPEPPPASLPMGTVRSPLKRAIPPSPPPAGGGRPKSV